MQWSGNVAKYPNANVFCIFQGPVTQSGDMCPPLTSIIGLKHVTISYSFLNGIALRTSQGIFSFLPLDWWADSPQFHESWPVIVIHTQPWQDKHLQRYGLSLWGSLFTLVWDTGVAFHSQRIRSQIFLCDSILCLIGLYSIKNGFFSLCCGLTLNNKGQNWVNYVDRLTQMVFSQKSTWRASLGFFSYIPIFIPWIKGSSINHLGGMVRIFMTWSKLFFWTSSVCNSLNYFWNFLHLDFLWQNWLVFFFFLFLYYCSQYHVLY